MLHPCCRPCGCCWLYSCAPLWAGACVVAFPPTHFACCVCCGCCEEEQTLHHQHARKVHMVHMAHTWSSLPTNAPTHQEEQTRLPQHTHGISSTCNQLIMKLKLMNMSRVLAWSSKLSVRASPWLQTQPAHSETSPVHACAFRCCPGCMGWSPSGSFLQLPNIESLLSTALLTAPLVTKTCMPRQTSLLGLPAKF